MQRRLVIVLGDQLDRRSAAFDGFDRTRDRVWMAEVAEESTHVWTHKARIAVFLSAMRHFRDALAADGITIDYTELKAKPSQKEPGTLADALVAGLERHKAAETTGQRPRADQAKICARQMHSRMISVPSIPCQPSTTPTRARPMPSAAGRRSG